MIKLCLNSRDELIIINLEKVAFLEANGNYTKLFYIEEKQQLLISLGLSKVEAMIREVLPKGKQSAFIRMGRSIIINQNYLCHINILKQRLTLSDCGKNIYHLNISKVLLKEYKDIIQKQYGNSNR